MKQFTKVNIKDIPMEEAHGGSGVRQVLVRPVQLTSPYFEMMTKGFLRAGGIFDWHVHEKIDEVVIILKGNGKFYWENNLVNYQEGDIITIPSNSKHKIVANAQGPSEFYFIRIKSG